MANFSRRNKIVLAFVIVIVVGYLVVLFWQSQNQIPVAFTNAESQGAIIAENIVTTSNQSTATLALVNKEDEQGDYKDALTQVPA